MPEKAEREYRALVMRVYAIDREAADFIVNPRFAAERVEAFFKKANNLNTMFTWRNTPQGQRYWEALHGKIGIVKLAA